MNDNNNFEFLARLLTFSEERPFSSQLKGKEQLVMYNSHKKMNSAITLKDIRELWHSKRSGESLERRIKLLMNDAVFLRGKMMQIIDSLDKVRYRFIAGNNCYDLVIDNLLKYFILNETMYWEPQKGTVDKPKNTHSYLIPCLESDIKSLNRKSQGPNLNACGELMDKWHGSNFLKSWQAHTYRVYEGNIQLQKRYESDSSPTIPIVVSFDLEYSKEKDIELIQAKLETDSRWKFR